MTDIVIDLDAARRRILAKEKLTLEEHQQLLRAWRAKRGAINTPAKAKPSKTVMSLDDLMADFSGPKDAKAIPTPSDDQA